MPYPGVPKDKTKQMESCVTQVMADPKMKAKYKDAKERKSHAIAVCNASITGSKKVDALINDLVKGESNQKGGENKTETMFKLSEHFTADELEKMDDKMKECVRSQMEKGKSKEDAMKACEVEPKKADEPKDVKKADGDEPKDGEQPTEGETPKADETPTEVKPEGDKPEGEAEAGKPADAAESDKEEVDEETEDEGDVKKDLDPIEVLKSIAEMKDPKEIREAITAALGQLTKSDENGKTSQPSNVAVDVKETLETIVHKLDILESIVKADETEETDADDAEDKGEEAPAGESKEVSAEGNSDEPKGDEAKATEPETPAETPVDTPKDGESQPSEALTKVEKVESAVEKINSEVSEVKDALTKLTEAVDKIAKQPVQSKVVSPSVVNKSFEVSDESSTRIKEINGELKKLWDMRQNDPSRYQRENKADEAFKLLDEKERLESGLM